MGGAGSGAGTQLDNEFDITQSLPQMFLILYEIYSNLLKKKSNNDFHEIFSIDTKSDGDLFQMFERCGKEAFFVSAIEQLKELNIVLLDDDDNIINGTRWFIFLHFYILKNGIDSNNTLSSHQLHESLRNNHQMTRSTRTCRDTCTTRFIWPHF